MSETPVEYTVNCAVCGGQYFQSKVAGDRCELCAMCKFCGDDMPRVLSQTWETLCSQQCEASHRAHVAEYSQVLVARKIRSEIARSYRVAAKTRIFERDNWQCHLCGGPINRKVTWPAGDSAVIDHVIPKTKGGWNTADNLRTAHALCNNQRSDMDLEEFLKGFRRTGF